MESKLVFETLESDPDGIIEASEQILNVQGTQFLPFTWNVPVNIALRRVWKYNFPVLSSSTSITFSTKMQQRITTL